MTHSRAVVPARQFRRAAGALGRSLGLALGVALWQALGLVLGLASIPPANARAARPAAMQVGSLQLRPCVTAPALCGRLERALDPAGVVPGRISIAFEYYRHSVAGETSGTLVATEGGPGYPATESRDDYLALLAPLLAKRDFLLMDNRGTGRSGAVDCHDLQSGPAWTVDSVAACGNALGAAAPLYSTAFAADDLAAILDALAIDRIDLYGNSYGTYFEQVFAVRHPARLRSIVLDGAYPLTGRDYAWYPTYAPAMRNKFNLACARSPACAALPGTSIDHMLPALAELRRTPVAARAADSDGVDRAFTADAAHLAITLFGSAPAFGTVREADAAARAFVQGDREPLLRLMAQSISSVDSRDPSSDPAKWSAGLAAAVMCQDPPQIFDMRVPPEQRARDRDRLVAERQRAFPDTYAPFTVDEYRDMPLDYSFIDQCVAWPIAPTQHPASQVVAAAPVYPDIPALVISGELDNMTTVADGAAVARAFKQGRQILIANSFHVNALPRARSGCGAQIVRHFFDARAVGDVGCAGRVPPVRLLPRFALQASQLDPLLSGTGNRADTEQMRLAAAVLYTVGDALTLAKSNTTGHGRGLRGGRFMVGRGSNVMTVGLRELRWTRDVTVTGQVTAPAGRAGQVQGNVRFRTPSGVTGTLEMQWQEGPAEPTATVTGQISKAAVVAQGAAP